MAFRRCCLVAVILCAATNVPALAQGKPTQVTTYIASANNVLEDLRFMVEELAGEPDIWEEKVYPNIDVFLIGVDPEQPVRFDSVLDPETGVRSLLMIPLPGGDANEFLKDNLDPIGVFSRVRAGRPPRPELWELYSDPSAPIFDGWMRAAHGYGFISKIQEDVPQGIAAPAASHSHLVERGVDLAVQLLTPQPGEADRAAAFAKYRENIESALAPYDNETEEEFALRSLVVKQQFDRLEVLFMQTSDLSATWTLNEGVGMLDVIVAPQPDSQLQVDFEGSVGRESFFARVPIGENSVMTGRMNMLLSETLKEHFSTFYTQAIPVVQQQIDEYEKYDAQQRESRKQAIGIVLQMLADNAADGNVDAFIEMTEAGGGLHTMVSGLTFASTEPVGELLNAIIGFDSSWTLEENVATVGNVTVHKVHCANGYPQALAEFFGADGDYYVGVDGTHLWVASGVDALETMTTAIEQVQNESGTAADIPVFQLDFQVRPILKLVDGWADESAIDLMAFFKQGGFANQNRERENRAAREEGEEPLMAAFKDFDWQGIMQRSLEGSEARIETLFDLNEDAVLLGRTVIQTDVLRAVGEVIAEFADEQL